MTTTADTAVQPSAVETPSRKGAKTTDTTTGKPSTGLHYEGQHPKAIRKTIQPSLKEEVDILFDFAMPDDDKLILDDKTLGKMLNDLKADDKAPRYWFNTLVRKTDYEKTLWFILNLKATLLSSANVNLLKELRLSDKVSPQDIQEVGAIASLYEKKSDKEKIIDLNTRAVKEYILNDDKHSSEELKEILLNIALGNLGGLYQEIVRRDKGEQ